MKNILTMGVLLAVMVVGLVSIAGMKDTGAVVRNTGVITTPSCECQMISYDYYGNPIDVKEQVIRARRGAAHNDVNCQNRCKSHFSPRRNRAVKGWAI